MHGCIAAEGGDASRAVSGHCADQGEPPNCVPRKNGQINAGGAAVHRIRSGLSGLREAGDLLPLHPAVKPIALVADALLDTSARGDIVLDAFLGSGSTLIAA